MSTTRRLVFGVDVVCHYCAQVHPTSSPCGANLRDYGMEVVADAEASANPHWAIDAKAWIRARAEGTRLMAEDCTAMVGRPERFNAVGPVFAEMARRGFIRRVGVGNAKRAPRHAGPATIWVRTAKR
jgi:hypothetical protein